MNANKQPMKKSSKKDDIGRLDHRREAENRAKNKRDWLSEYEAEVKDEIKQAEAYESLLFDD